MDKELHKRFLTIAAKYINNKFEEGYFAEFGCCPGITAQILAKTLQRKGCFFDTWGDVPHYDEIDIPSIEHKNSIIAAMKKSKQYCKSDNPRNYIKVFKKLLKEVGALKLSEIVKGDICITVPQFMANTSYSFVFAHIDCNMYTPAKICLNELWAHIADGGLVFLDDYKDPAWPGIEQAVNEFLQVSNNYNFLDLNACGSNNGMFIKGDEKEFQLFWEYLKPYLLDYKLQRSDNVNNFYRIIK